MLREEVLQEWRIIRDNLVSEKFVKAEADKLQQQEFSQKTNRIAVLEKELEQERRKQNEFISNLVEIVNYLVLREPKTIIESKIKFAQESFLFLPESRPQSAVIISNLN